MMMLSTRILCIDSMPIMIQTRACLQRDGGPTRMSYGYAQIYSVEESGGYFRPYGVIRNGASEAERYRNFTDRGYPVPRIADSLGTTSGGAARYEWSGDTSADLGISGAWHIDAAGSAAGFGGGSGAATTPVADSE